MRFVVVAILAASLLGAERASASYTGAVNAGTLQLTGNGAGDKLALRLAVGVPTMLEVDVGNNGSAELTFDRTTFTAIAVSAGGGNDLVFVDVSQGAFADEGILIDGGTGNDTLLGATGVEILVGGDGDDLVDGGQGADTIFLGAGDDVANWDPGDGSDTIEGGADDDTLVFNASVAAEIVACSPNGGRVLVTRNVGAITMDLDDVEQVDLALFGGVDSVTVNDLAGTDLVRVNVELEGTAGSEAGDSQADSLAVNGTAGADTVSVGVAKGVLEVAGLAATVRVAHGESAFDTLAFTVLGADHVHVLGTSKADVVAIAPSPVVGAVRATVDTFPIPIDVSGGGRLVVFGLGGNDTITGTTGINALGTALELDGGSGNDLITGGDGADTIIGGTGNDRVTGSTGGDLLQLGSGNDVAIWQPGDGSDAIEGEQGTDSLDFRCSVGAEIVALSPSANHAVLTRNIGAIAMDLVGVEQVGIAALAGADQITVNDMTGTDVKGVTIDLESALDSGVGDAAIDAIVVNGTALADKMSISAGTKGVSLSRKGGNVRIEHAELTDTLTVNGGAGDDKIGVSSSVSSAMTLTLNPN